MGRMKELAIHIDEVLVLGQRLTDAGEWTPDEVEASLEAEDGYELAVDMYAAIEDLIDFFAGKGALQNYYLSKFPSKDKVTA